MRKLQLSVGFVVLVAAAVAAQQKAPSRDPARAMPAENDNPIVASIKSSYTGLRNNLTKSAEMVPEAKYTFKPAGVAAEVRSLGQLIGHIANANYMFCGGVAGDPVNGERGPGGADYEKTTAKADLLKALAASFTVCDKAFAAVNDRNGASAVTSLPIGPTTKIGGLASNNVHLAEHYGNIVTYLRAMGMVPPSSQPSK
jgi:uncharacterized damage-inducible protein DinB